MLTPSVKSIGIGALFQLVPVVLQSISVDSYEEFASKSFILLSVISLTDRFHDTVTSYPYAVATLLDQLVFQQ